MPRPASTSQKADTIISSKENVQYIVKGSDPVYGAIGVVTCVLLLAAIAMKYAELRQFYNYGWAIFFAS